MMMISFYWQFCPTSFIVYVINFKIYCTYLVFGWWNGVCVMWSSCVSQTTTRDSHFSTFSLHLLWDEQPPWPYLLPWSMPQGWVNIFSELSEYLPRAEWDPSQGWVVYAYCFVKFYCNTANMFICLSAASSVLGFSFLWWNTMMINNLGRKGFDSFTLPHDCSSSNVHHQRKSGKQFQQGRNPVSRADADTMELACSAWQAPRTTSATTHNGWNTPTVITS